MKNPLSMREVNVNVSIQQSTKSLFLAHGLIAHLFIVQERVSLQIFSSQTTTQSLFFPPFSSSTRGFFSLKDSILIKRNNPPVLSETVLFSLIVCSHAKPLPTVSCFCCFFPALLQFGSICSLAGTICAQAMKTE